MNPFLELPGAVADAEVGVAAHFGEPLPEQRALAAGDAFVDLSHNGIVVVSGEDRLSWLHSMTSQQLTGLRPGESVETILLDPNGRIERVIRLVDDGERAWLLVDAGSAEPLAAFLVRMRFALRVDVQDVSAEYAAILAFEGAAAGALRSLGPAAEWRDPWASVARGGVQYAHGEHAGADWSAVQFVFARDQLSAVAALARSGSVRVAGLMALDALEVRAWRPSQHGEVDARAIPHELDWMRTAVHLNKGCYRGQETIAKVHNLGHPPRRLVLLHLDGSGGELPVPGALVYREGEAQDPESRPVGRVTRAVLHYEWGGIALALLKRAVPEDAPLELRAGETGAEPGNVEGQRIAASQEIVVPADAGRTRTIEPTVRLTPRRETPTG
ncbi:folate-binding protein YgfZ [Leucobacter coleopterorum]|uniref:Folate-binding protein YgfZ n=1 Tax=Leucobacter coleopterorum TaxID=2714933 RepID=A0ABX6K256_9MICO|nr:folate-binding protein YgfZ [Leucobacter coleopterorum]QIM19199.1 folate-binding protein YgfZ [Leucobacter coleopterorum]